MHHPPAPVDEAAGRSVPLGRSKAPAAQAHLRSGGEDPRTPAPQSAGSRRRAASGNPCRWLASAGSCSRRWPLRPASPASHSCRRVSGHGAHAQLPGCERRASSRGRRGNPVPGRPAPWRRGPRQLRAGRHSCARGRPARGAGWWSSAGRAVLARWPVASQPAVPPASVSPFPPQQRLLSRCENEECKNVL